MTVQTAQGWEIHHGPDGTMGRAQFNEDRTRRTVLIRRWAHALGEQVEGVEPLTWVMLNPSSAGAEQDDPTIRKCVGYAKRWGYGGIRVLNLFDLIATDPEILRHPAVADAASSAENEQAWRTWLLPTTGNTWSAMEQRPDVVVAWGSLHTVSSRIAEHAVHWAVGLLEQGGIEPTCLGVTQAGMPLHPGRTSYDLQRVPWKGAETT